MPGTTVVEPKPQAYYITIFGKEIDGTYYEDETYLLYEGLGTLVSTDLEIYKYPHPGENLKTLMTNLLEKQQIMRLRREPFRYMSMDII